MRGLKKDSDLFVLTNISETQLVKKTQINMLSVFKLVSIFPFHILEPYVLPSFMDQKKKGDCLMEQISSSRVFH